MENMIKQAVVNIIAAEKPDKWIFKNTTSTTPVVSGMLFMGWQDKVRIWKESGSLGLKIYSEPLYSIKAYAFNVDDSKLHCHVLYPRLDNEDWGTKAYRFNFDDVETLHWLPYNDREYALCPGIPTPLPWIPPVVPPAWKGVHGGYYLGVTVFNGMDGVITVVRKTLSVPSSPTAVIDEQTDYLRAVMEFATDKNYGWSDLKPDFRFSHLAITFGRGNVVSAFDKQHEMFRYSFPSMNSWDYYSGLCSNVVMIDLPYGFSTELDTFRSYTCLNNIAGNDPFRVPEPYFHIDHENGDPSSRRFRVSNVKMRIKDHLGFWHEPNGDPFLIEKYNI